MTRLLQSVFALYTLAVTGAILYGGWGLNRHAIAMLDAWRDVGAGVEKASSKASSTLDAVNAPCVGFHGSVTCGPIAQLSQTEKNVGIVAGLSAQQVRQSGVLIDAAAISVEEVSAHVNKTADALTETAQGATATLAEGKRTIAAAQPLLAAYTQSGNDLDALMKDHAIHDTLTDLQVTTQNIGGITADLRQVSDKETAEFLKPTPWWQWPFRRAGQFIDIGAAVARNIP